MLNASFRFTIVAALALAMHAVVPTPSLAQQWPTRPMRFVLPFGPGSGADTAALKEQYDQVARIASVLGIARKK